MQLNEIEEIEIKPFSSSLNKPLKYYYHIYLIKTEIINLVPIQRFLSDSTTMHQRIYSTSLINLAFSIKQ